MIQLSSTAFANKISKTSDNFDISNTFCLFNILKIVRFSDNFFTQCPFHRFINFLFCLSRKEGRGPRDTGPKLEN